MTEINTDLPGVHLKLNSTFSTNEEPTLCQNINNSPLSLNQGLAGKLKIIPSNPNDPLSLLAKKILSVNTPKSEIKSPFESNTEFQKTLENICQHHSVVSNNSLKLSELYHQLCVLWSLTPKELEKIPNFLKSYHAIHTLSSKKQQAQALSTLILAQLEHSKNLQSTWNTLVTNIPRCSGKKQKHAFACALFYAPLLNYASNKEIIESLAIFLSLCKQSLFLNSAQQKALFSLLFNTKKECINTKQFLDALKSLSLSASRRPQQEVLKKEIELLRLLIKSPQANAALKCRSLNELEKLFWKGFKEILFDIDNISPKQFASIYKRYPKLALLCQEYKEENVKISTQFLNSLIQDNYSNVIHDTDHLKYIFKNFPQIKDSWLANQADPSTALECLHLINSNDLEPLMDGKFRFISIKDPSGKILACQSYYLAWNRDLSCPVLVLGEGFGLENAELSEKVHDQAIEEAQKLKVSLLCKESDTEQELYPYAIYQVESTKTYRKEPPLCTLYAHKSAQPLSYLNDVLFATENIGKIKDPTFLNSITHEQLSDLACLHAQKSRTRDFINTWATKTSVDHMQQIYRWARSEQYVSPEDMWHSVKKEPSSWKLAVWEFILQHTPVVTLDRALIPNSSQSLTNWHFAILGERNTIYSKHPGSFYSTPSKSLYKNAALPILRYASFINTKTFFQKDYPFLHKNFDAKSASKIRFNGLCGSTFQKECFSQWDSKESILEEDKEFLRLFSFALYQDYYREETIDGKYQQDIYEILSVLYPESQKIKKFSNSEQFNLIYNVINDKKEQRPLNTVIQNLEDSTNQPLLLRYVKNSPKETLAALKQADKALSTMTLVKIALAIDSKQLPLIKENLRSLPKHYRIVLAHFHGRNLEETDSSFSEILDHLSIRKNIDRHMLLIEHCKSQDSISAFLQEDIKFDDTTLLYPIFSHLAEVSDFPILVQDWINKGLDLSKDPVLVWFLAHYGDDHAKRIVGPSCDQWDWELKFDWLLARARNSSVLLKHDPFLQIPAIKNHIIKLFMYQAKNNQHLFTDKFHKSFPEERENLTNTHRILYLKETLEQEKRFTGSLHWPDIEYLDTLTKVVSSNPSYICNNWDSFEASQEVKTSILQHLARIDPQSTIRNLNNIPHDDALIQTLKGSIQTQTWLPGLRRYVRCYFEDFLKQAEGELKMLNALSDKEVYQLYRKLPKASEVIAAHRMREVLPKYLSEIIQFCLRQNLTKLQKKREYFDLSKLPKEDAPDLFAQLIHSSVMKWDDIYAELSVLDDKIVKKAILGACLEEGKISSNTFRKSSASSLVQQLKDLNTHTLNQEEIDAIIAQERVVDSPLITKVFNQAKESESIHSQNALLHFTTIYSLLCLNYSLEPYEVEKDPNFRQSLENLLQLRSPEHRAFCLNKLLFLCLPEQSDKKAVWKQLINQSSSKPSDVHNLELTLAIPLAYINTTKKELLETHQALCRQQVFLNTPDLLTFLNCLKALLRLPRHKKSKINWLKQITQLANSQKEKKSVKEKLEAFVYLQSSKGTFCALQNKEGVKSIILNDLKIFPALFETNTPLQFLNTFAKFRQPFALQNYIHSLKQLNTLSGNQCIDLVEVFIKSVMSQNFQKDRYNTTHLDTIFAQHPNLKEKWAKSISLSDQELAKHGLNPKWQVIDTDDPNDILLCGTEVSGSCMNVHKKEYNRSLICYLMDGKYRLIAIKNASGIIISRCLIRLMWDDKTQVPVIYVETRYGANAYKEYERALNELVIKKAKAMNLDATCSFYRGEHKQAYSYYLHSLGGPAPYEWTDAKANCAGSQYKHSAYYLNSSIHKINR